MSARGACFEHRCVLVGFVQRRRSQGHLTCTLTATCGPYIVDLSKPNVVRGGRSPKGRGSDAQATGRRANTSENSNGLIQDGEPVNLPATLQSEFCLKYLLRLVSGLCLHTFSYSKRGPRTYQGGRGARSRLASGSVIACVVSLHLLCDSLQQDQFRTGATP